MKRNVVWIGVVALAAWSGMSLAAITAPVRIDTGLVSGVAESDPSITVFRGIPYAAPPVGALRWRAPQPALKWQGVRKADQFGPLCPQPVPRGEAPQAMSEDCLHVNVWTGAKSSRERRPVMVWIHGSGEGQSAHMPLYRGESLAKKGVVVVSVDYRIGVFGSLATTALSQESGHNASGDWAILDDIAALQWVKRNVAAFGGDADNVTLFGQSHGAAMQHLLVMSPQAKGLFRRVIMQSHARYPRDPTLMEVATRYQSLQEAEASGAEFMTRLGVKSLQELRELPWQKLVDTPFTGVSFVVDGHVVPRNYTATYAQGTQNDVLVIAGFNQDETGASPETNFERVNSRPPARRTNNNPQAIGRLADYQQFAQQRFGALADEFLRVYPAGNDREAFSAFARYTRDNGRVSLWTWANAWRVHATQPVYLYFWSHAPPGRNHDFTGAYHGSEIAYAFNHGVLPDEPWSDEDRRIGDTLSSYWVNFAKTGNPNGPGLPRWPSFDGKTQQVMELGAAFRPIPLSDPAKVDFWQRFYATQPEL